MTQDKMVRWHHWLNGHEFEQILWNGEGWGSLACCSPWCCKKSDMTEWLNNNNKESCVSFLILWTGDRKKPGSCSSGQGLALWGFNSIFCWWVVLYFLYGSCLAWGPSPGVYGLLVGLIADSKRVYAKENLPSWGYQVPASLWQVPGNPHLHRRPSNTSR